VENYLLWKDMMRDAASRHLVEWWPKKDELEQSLRSQLLS
jgi:hypothetical protein